MKQEIRNILTSLGFTQAKGQSMLYEKQLNDTEAAYVDFRKPAYAEKGRRFLKRGDNFDVDPDTVPVLAEFKKQRDEILQSSEKAEKKEDPGEYREASPGNLGQDKPIQKNEGDIASPAKGVQSSPCPTFEYIKELVGDDILELFGDTGTGKSKFVHALALEAITAGKKVYFLDTERNLSREDVKALGDCYHYTPLFAEIKELVLKKLPKCDMVVIDSVGLPILTRFATYSMKERGNALLDLIAVVGRLKEWAYENSALAVITNQPESEFGKQEGDIRKPFGDKACFAAKEIWLTRKLKASGMTRCSIESFRSRSMKSGLNILQLEITDSGTKIVR